MRYTLARGLSEVVERPDVILVGNGRRLVYRRGSTTPAQVVNQKEIKFTEVGLWLRNVLFGKPSAESSHSCGGLMLVTHTAFKMKTKISCLFLVCSFKTLKLKIKKLISKPACCCVRITGSIPTGAQ